MPLTPGLTNRESQILPLISQGLTRKEIAQELSLSPLTIRGYLESLYKKLGTKNRVECAIYYQKLKGNKNATYYTTADSVIHTG